jgi:hypothetical protein
VRSSPDREGSRLQAPKCGDRSNGFRIHEGDSCRQAGVVAAESFIIRLAVSLTHDDMIDADALQMRDFVVGVGACNHRHLRIQDPSLAASVTAGDNERTGS